MSNNDQFNKKNANKPNQNSKHKKSPIRTNQHNVEFAEEAAREAGISVEVYRQNKPQ